MTNAPSLNRSLFISDNLPILRGIDTESVDLIATDPPFNKGVKAFEGTVTAGVGKEGRKVSYKDTWTWREDVQGEWTAAIKDDHPNLYAVVQAANAAAGEDMGAFLCWLGVRVLEMHRILKPTGSLYLHIDHTAHAYAKALLDAVFGRANFRNEIVWYKGYRGTPLRSAWQHEHDVLLYYVKGDGFTWNQPTGDYRDKTMARYNKVDSDGQRYALIKRRRSDGTVYYGKTYPNGKPAGNVIEIPTLAATDGERTGYPTQKPLALYERLIKASSNEGDLVLDPFAGCATTCVAAERLGRQWIGIDINVDAETVLRQRLDMEIQESMAWNDALTVRTEPPKRTDDGEDAAPELVLVSPKPKGPTMTLRQLRERLSLRDGPYCQGCGFTPPHNLAEYLDIDHKLPKSLKGSDDLHNRVLLCSPCNGVKSNRLTLAELRLKRIEDGRMLSTSWDKAWYDRIGRFGEGA